MAYIDKNGVCQDDGCFRDIRERTVPRRSYTCVERELSQVEAERDKYKPYFDALRKRHNGYDPEFRKDSGCTEPATPEIALDELTEEADSLAVDAPIHAVLTRLKTRNDKLMAGLTLAMEWLDSVCDPECYDLRTPAGVAVHAKLVALLKEVEK